MSLILLTKERVIILKTKQKNIFLILILLIIIGFVIVWIMHNQKQEDNTEINFTEYTPQEEITSEQLRQTLITLYFENKETKTLMPEARMIDSKILLNNPYEELVKLILIGPKNDSLKKVIPEGTNINKVEFVKGIVHIDFSEEFVKVGNLGADEESKIIYSIVNTLTELTEVRGVKILINGEENKCFEDGAIKFNDIFVRKTESAI